MSKVEALLMITPGCPHCPQMLQAMTDFIKEGLLARLEVVNVEQEPERAAELGVRSAPWLRLGQFILQGNYSKNELRHWVEQASRAEGVMDYLQHLLLEGQLQQAERLLQEQPQLLGDILPWLADVERPLPLRVGVMALFEGFTGRGELQALLDEISRYSRHANAQVRADMCHLLGLTHHPDAMAPLGHCLEDEDGEVREIAAEALNDLRGGQA